MQANREVVFLSAVRTAIGGYGGSLKDVPPAELGALCVREAIKRAGIEAKTVESCVVGSVLRSEARDAYMSRLVAINGGLDIASHAVTVNRLCGSGLEAIVNATQQIQTGEVTTAIAGGCESMSKATYSMKSNRWGQRMGNSEIEDDMTVALHDPFGTGHMGVTAENLSEKFDVSREEQDKLAETSHARAINAIEQGYFKEQIVPVELKTRKGVTVFDTDEHPRKGTTAESISAMKTLFKKDGTVTAANASGINDGAAMTLMMERSAAEAQGLKPLARVVSYARAGVEPSIMGIGPVPAVKLALQRAELSVADLDVIESNEAFAAQACSVAKELGFPADKTNPNGGAVALGHPIGASGAVLMTKLIYELQRTKGRYGLVTLCIGGGQGIAMVIEAL
ncbi:beta-ketothiolase BktB [Dasania sp. GY-MA-18]|uniref:Beta-ketothiolase BktB n=1 Tax=Dasania phycosphaerae TaxID=2950436 RepID=A0A9J6RMJ2_9GAMM|nr:MULTISPECIES: beta-ketothiolase BktB [Dasania]MCR8922977.1 beta-ketothiolase BktB [Dasania sp. GY-MA-18]MCZ0865408.1 beta-ketothiolase BktB [Dasania phycosphaerae]MCZ0869133.1 beta-ketothiolase BktB [Dasania phycosphaerae]